MKQFSEDLAGDALSFATKKHSGQYRRSGLPYISHPKRVGDIVKGVNPSKRKSQELSAAASLHDTLEDTDTSYKELLQTFGPKVADIVLELTSDKEEIAKVGKTEYLRKKLAHISPWGLLVKLADRLSNVEDLEEADEDWAESYAQQTKDILIYLEDHVDLNKPQKRLIKEIENITNDFLNRRK